MAKIPDFGQNWIGLDAGFQATGVAITEVRDASREENGQGGGVRRLALNRCLSPLLSLCLWIFDKLDFSQVVFVRS